MDMSKFGEGLYVTVDFVSKLTSRVGVIVRPGEVKQGKFGEKVEFAVEFAGKAKLWSPTMKHVGLLIQAYGSDDSSWVGKKVLFLIENGKLTIQPQVV